MQFTRKHGNVSPPNRKSLAEYGYDIGNKVPGYGVNQAITTRLGPG
jgi:hypothetical protein